MKYHTHVVWLAIVLVAAALVAPRMRRQPVPVPVPVPAPAAGVSLDPAVTQLRWQSTAPDGVYVFTLSPAADGASYTSTLTHGQSQQSRHGTIVREYYARILTNLSGHIGPAMEEPGPPDGVSQTQLVVTRPGQQWTIDFGSPSGEAQSQIKTLMEAELPGWELASLRKGHAQ